MKKILIAASLMLSAFLAQSQVIDTTKNVAAVKIKPFMAKFNDSVQVTHLAVQITGDNLKDYCSLRWSVMDSVGRESVSGFSIIKGEDYKNWSGANLFPFIFVAKQYNLTFLK